MQEKIYIWNKRIKREKIQNENVNISIPKETLKFQLGT